jgi:hypothetical protein
VRAAASGTASFIRFLEEVGIGRTTEGRGGAHGGMGNHDDVSSPQCMFLIVSVPLLYPTFLAVSQPRSHISWATIMSCRLSLAATRKLAELCPNLESLLWTGFAWILSSTHTSLQRMHG